MNRINIEKKVTKVNGKKVAFSFWDIAGQQGYKYESNNKLLNHIIKN